MRHAFRDIGLAPILAAGVSAPVAARCMSISSQSVTAFLTEFEALAEKEDFSLIEHDR